MKLPLLFSILSVVVYLIWLGYHYLKALGNAFGNANPATGPGDIAFVFILIGIATLACVIGSFFSTPASARWVALSPMLLVILGQGFISFRESSNRQRYANEQSVRASANQAKLETISRDFVLEVGEGEPGAFKASFLTVDQELDTIVRIDVGYGSGISAYCVGKIRGKNLELFKNDPSLDEFYQRYRDQENKSIFDRYEASYQADQDYRDYDLEKFEP